MCNRRHFTYQSPSGQIGFIYDILQGSSSSFVAGTSLPSLIGSRELNKYHQHLHNGNKREQRGQFWVVRSLEGEQQSRIHEPKPIVIQRFTAHFALLNILRYSYSFKCYRSIIGFIGWVFHLNSSCFFKWFPKEHWNVRYNVTSLKQVVYL